MTIASEPSPHPFSANELLAAVGASVLTLAFFLLRFGYDFGVSDQEEFLAAVHHLRNADLFSTDWYVTSQAGQVTVRTPTVFLIFGLSAIMTVQTAVSFLFTMAFVGTSTSIYFLSRRFGASRIMSLGASVAAIVMTPRWTIGGNDLVQSIFTPSMLGWALALGGVTVYLYNRRLLGAVLLGLAVYFQPLVGIQVAGILFLSSLIADWLTKTVDWNVIGRILGSFCVFALIATPFMYFVLSGSGSADVPPGDVFEILGVLRAPHHYLFSQFPVRDIALFLLLAVGGTVSLVLGQHDIRYFGLVAIACILLFCIAGYVFTELVPTLFVLKLQLFKSSVFAKTVAIAGAAATLSLVPWFGRAHTSTGPAASKSNAFAVICVICGVVLIAIQAFTSTGGFATGSNRSIDGMSSLERWVNKETRRDALFAIPPSNSRFRLAAMRSILINFKAFPFQEQNIVEWRLRLEALAGAIPPAMTTADRLEALDELYEHKSPEELLRLHDQYGVTHFVRRTPIPREARRFELVFISHDGWRVYHVIIPGRR